MSYVVEFFAMMLTAVFIENIIFTRALGTSWGIFMLRHPKELTKYTEFLAVIVTAAGLIGYPLRSFTQNSEYAYVLTPMLYIVCMAAVYVAAYLLMKKFAPEYFEKYEKNLGAAVFNCAVLGSLLIPANDRLDLVGTVGYGLGMAAGFWIAVMLIGFGMERISYCKVPKAFKGLPVLLIYLGLLSLAFYGLSGHMLPT